MIECTSENFEKEVLQEKEKVVLVDFWAPWCNPCRMQTPILEKFEAAYGQTVKVCKVNTDEVPDLAARYGIQGIPALFVFKNGQIVKKAVGVQNPDAIRNLTGV